MKKPILHVLLIALVGLAAYSNTFSVPFHFDDDRNIVENPVIKDLEYFTDLSRARKFEIYNDFLSRFIGYLSFALNYRVHGLDVAGYHIVNLAIHIINALLVYWLALLTFRTPYFSKVPGFAPSPSRPAETGRTLIALFSALLFVSHPLQTQAVTYIVQRLASLATLFYLLSLVLYISWRLGQQSADDKGRIAKASTRLKPVFWYLASLFSAVLAMKTKEIAFTLPVIVTLYEFMFFQGRIRTRLLYLLPLLLTMLIIPLTLLSAAAPAGHIIGDMDAASRLQSSLSRGDYLLTQFRVIVTYIRLMFLPMNQNLDYDYPVFRSFLDPAVLSSSLLLLSIFGSGVYLLSRSRIRPSAARLAAFGIFWFFITLSVESSIIPIADVIFEHRMYLPSVFLSIMINSALLSVADRLSVQRFQMYYFIVAISAVLIVALAMTAYLRNSVWQDRTKMLEDTAVKSPFKERVHLNLGVEYKRGGQMAKAAAEYIFIIEKGNELTSISDAYNNLGRIYEVQDLIDDALNAYEQAVRLNLHNDIAHNNLGLIYLRKNLLDKAIDQFRFAINGTPDYAKAHYNLARAFLIKGLRKEAENEFQRACELGLCVR